MELDVGRVGGEDGGLFVFGVYNVFCIVGLLFYKKTKFSLGSLFKVVLFILFGKLVK